VVGFVAIFAYDGVSYGVDLAERSRSGWRAERSYAVVRITTGGRDAVWFQLTPPER